MLTAGDADLLGASDEQQLRRATEMARVVLTGDHDFLRLTQAPSVAFPGLIFLLPATPLGEAIRAVAFLATILEPADMENRVEWVP